MYTTYRCRYVQVGPGLNIAQMQYDGHVMLLPS